MTARVTGELFVLTQSLNEHDANRRNRHRIIIIIIEQGAYPLVGDFRYGSSSKINCRGVRTDNLQPRDHLFELRLPCTFEVDLD